MTAYDTALDALRHGAVIEIVNRGGGIPVLVAPDGTRRRIADKTFNALRVAGLISLATHFGGANGTTTVWAIARTTYLDHTMTNDASGQTEVRTRDGEYVGTFPSSRTAADAIELRDKLARRSGQ